LALTTKLGSAGSVAVGQRRWFTVPASRADRVRTVRCMNRDDLRLSYVRAVR